MNSSPAIGLDSYGTVIYVGSTDGRLYACHPGKSGDWYYPTGSALQSSPAIGMDGTIYVGSDNHSLYAINPNGTLKLPHWPFTTGGAIASSPVIGPDGTIYVG